VLDLLYYSFICFNIKYHNFSLRKEKELVLSFDYIIVLLAQSLECLCRRLLLLFDYFFRLDDITMLSLDADQFIFYFVLLYFQSTQIGFDGMSVNAEKDIVFKIGFLWHLFLRHADLSLRVMGLHHDIILLCYSLNLKGTVFSLLSDWLRLWLASYRLYLDHFRSHSFYIVFV